MGVGHTHDRSTGIPGKIEVDLVITRGIDDQRLPVADQ
jgi:hypothetical protein